MKISDKKSKLQFINKTLFLLALIVIAAFAIRVYYFSQTTTQALWWDEAEYGATAKYFAGEISSVELNAQRPFLFPALISLLFRAGISEPVIKFLFVLIPSVLLVVCVFFLGKAMFNKRIGLIAALLTAVSWTLIFWSNRLQPDFISVCLQVMAVTFMWSYWKSPSRKLIVLSALTASLAFQFKVSALLVPLSFFVFMLAYERTSLFVKKDYWIFLLVFVIALSPQFIYSHIAFGSPLSFLTDSGYAAAVVVEPNPIGWYNLQFFYTLTLSPLFWIFIIGVFMSVGFILYPDRLMKDKKLLLDPALFSILLMLLVSAFYIFYIRGTEDRWVFLWLPFIFMLAANPLDKIQSYFKAKNQQTIGLIIIALILVTIGYVQIPHAGTLIENKLPSYGPVKEAGLWLRLNSDTEDLIITQSQTQIAYYAERQVGHFTLGQNESDFNMFFEERRPRFVMISIFENHPEWVSDWISRHQDMLVPVRVYYEGQSENPLLVIYEVKNATN